MTGGRVYVRHNAFGIDREAIEARLGEGAKVELKDLDSEGLLDVDDLLSHYADELRATGQDEEAERIGAALAADATSNFLMIVPAQGPGGSAASRPSRACSAGSGQEVRDSADLAEQAVEHRLGVGVDAPLGVLAVLPRPDRCGAPACPGACRCAFRLLRSRCLT